MNRRYVVLVAAVLAGALGVSVAARLPRGSHARPEAPAAAPVVELALRLAGGKIVPEASSVPRDVRVRLRLANDDGRRVAIRLAGYEDRVSIDGLAPDSAWSVEFVADLPGEGFAWLVDGQPAGRLAVTGSHLIEGHR